MDKVYIVTKYTDVIDSVMEIIVAVCKDPWTANDYMDTHPLEGADIEEDKHGHEWYSVDEYKVI